jgi:NADH-quinone oxidoreductase subunit K
MIEFNYYLLITFLCLFHIGVLGLTLNRGNVLKTIMFLEILLLSVNFSFIIFSLYLDDMVGYIFVLFVLVLSATESSIGLSLLSIFYEQRDDIALDSIKIQTQNFKI